MNKSIEKFEEKLNINPEFFGLFQEEINNICSKNNSNNLLKLLDNDKTDDDKTDDNNNTDEDKFDKQEKSSKIKKSDLLNKQEIKITKKEIDTLKKIINTLNKKYFF